MFGAIGDAIDTANKVLGDAPVPGQTATDGPAKFTQGEPINNDKDTPGTAVAPNNSGTKPNLHNHSRQTEFIHFGYVHLDRGDQFPHPLFDPAKLDPCPGHAIEFRDAVEREAILLNGFISNTKKALDEASAGEGVAGQALGAISSLTGGGGDPKPDTSAFEAALKKVGTAGLSVLPVVIQYPPIHKAGLDLHHARTNYQTAVSKRNNAPAAAGGVGSLIPVPAIGGAVDFVQKILFKPMDVSLAMALGPLAAYEDAIIAACHGMTLYAIHEQQPLTFPVWFPVPEKPEGPVAPSTDPKIVQDVKDEVKSAENTAEGYKKTLQDFLDITDEKAAPGDDFLAQAFTGILTADLQLQSLKKGLGLDSLPGPLVSVLTEIASACGNILLVAYKKILKQSGAKPVDKQFLLAASDEFLAEKMIGFVISLVPLLDPRHSVAIGGLGTVGANTLDKKAEDLLEAKLGPEMNLVLQFAIGQLGDQLNAVQADAARNSTLTMESFLGVLPRVYCLLVRNVFFPIFDLIMDKVFGLGNNALASGLSPIKSMLKTGKDIAGTAEDAKNRVNNAANMLQQGVTQDNVGNFVDAIKNGTPAAAGSTQAAGGAMFPGSPRQVTGSAVKIPKADLDKVEPDFQYDNAMPA